MPLANNPPNIVEYEGVQIDLSSISIRAALASALAFVPVIGPFLSAIAAVLPVKGRTQHLGVEEGYRNARKFVDDFYPRLRDALKDEKLRISYTRYLAKTLYTRYRTRWSFGNGLTELERLQDYFESTTDEIYTVYYLASYYFFRNADAEHVAEEFDRDFALWVRKDLQGFLTELREGRIEGEAPSTSGVQLAGLGILAGLAAAGFYLFKR